MLSEDIIAAIDRLAYTAGTNRSNMVNNILAGYISYRTPEMRMKSMFEMMESLLSSAEGMKVMLRSSDSLFNLRSALTYKYNPTVNYSIELYRTVTDAVGELRANLRTQNSSLKLYIMQFFKLWAGIENNYTDNPGGCSINGEKYIKTLALNYENSRDYNLSEEAISQAIVAYVSAFDGALKAFFYNLDDIHEAVSQAEAVYLGYRNSSPVII